MTSYNKKKKENQKLMVTKVLQELDRLLHKAIDDDRVGDLNVFEMIMVSADTLNTNYTRNSPPPTKGSTNNVVEFKKK